jgi:hypothetical protein
MGLSETTQPMNFALWSPVLAFLTVTETLLVLLGITLVVVSLCAIPQYFHQRRRQRTIAGLAGTPCPSCGQVLGKEAAGSVTTRVHWWHPAPGHTVAQLDLPSETIAITCPHCKAALDYRLDGRFFKMPT